MAATAKPVKPDEVQVEANFSRGMIRDSARSLLPEGGVWDAVDFCLEQPGKAYKRGGWHNHSAVLPGPPSLVAAVHAPTRVVAMVGSNLYDVTSEGGPQADLVGDVGFGVRENPANWIGNLIFCDGNCVNQPKRIHPTGPTGAMTIDPVHATAPYAAHSAVYSSRLALARGDTSSTDYSSAPHKDRIWFSELADPFTTWDTANKWVDTTYEITGLAPIQGVLLVFSPRFCERLIGGIPPGEEGENMELQPVGGVGCVDTRSIVLYDNQVIFGSEEGIHLTNGVGFTNLMESSDRTGILSFWRNLFVMGEIRSVICGMLNRNYLFVSSNAAGGEYDFMCYLPTKTWWRTKNTSVNMYAPGATEAETLELYAAMRTHPHVARFSPILRQGRTDGNGVPVEPNMETRMFGSGPGMKAYGFGRISYEMRAALGNPTLEISQAVGIEGKNFLPVYESPLPESSNVSSGRADRARFRLFKDSQALYLRLDQHGASDQTEVFLIEVEHRPYNLPSDGE